MYTKYISISLYIYLHTDTMWYKYPSLSPYAYCGNNPLRYVDPSGKEFDPASNKIAQKTEKEVRAKLESLPAGNDDVRNELNKTLDDIQRMRADKSTIYSYKTTSSKDAKKNEISEPTTENIGKNRKGQDLIHLYYNSEGTLIHESRHGGDIARGTLAKDKSNYGVSHEISAYRAQYAFEGYIDYRPKLSIEAIEALGEARNKYFFHYTGGIQGIDKNFIKGIIEYYKSGRVNVPLYGRTSNFYER